MKICIVGGGSAGWMTASTLIKAYPDWDISLYESPDSTPVGVGEATTQTFREWLHFLELKDEQWMSACDATYKLSIRFHNFHKQNDTPWQYPFGVPRGYQRTANSWFFNAKKYNWNNDKFAKDYYLAAACADANKIPVNRSDFPLDKYTGFHIDAIKFANWLRDNYAIPRGVKHFLEKVDKSIIHSQKYDLYFDCTGFKSLLNDSQWLDYSDYLPNNKAWATRKEYTVHKVNELVPTVDCTALSCGWVWRIPTWSRVGTGYTFCDKFITTEDALHEFATHLKTDLEGFKLIDYKAGRKKEIWNGNVISIGLSSGFIEPLESNGLLSVHSFLLHFVKTLANRKNVTQYMRDTFNYKCGNEFDSFSAFVALHYALTQRNDSEYWRHISNIKYPKIGLLKKCQEIYMASPEQLNQLPNEESSFLTVIAGHGWNPFDNVTMKGIEFYEAMPDHKLEIPDWNLDSLPTPYEYYKQTIYN
tara:strand:+ start:99 stop:1520 length:1422 start_codon:yes stop_codon:yes gene_type:complete